MRILYYFFALTIVLASCKTVSHTGNTETKTATDSVTAIAQKTSIHQFTKVETLEGETFDFSEYKGKKILVVNTASKCGLTPQYEELQKLYETYKETGFTIVGFPSNDFLMQEPGDNGKIRTFCTEKFGVTFPMMTKVKVKGKEKHPVYQFLTQAEKNGVADSKVSWNFQKYLIDEEGFLVKHISPKTKPMDEEIVSWIKKG